MNEKQQELYMLERMETDQLRLFLVSQDLRYYRGRFNKVKQQLNSLRREENWYITVANRHLEYYNELSREEDWQAFEGYVELVETLHLYRQHLREQLVEITEMVRRYKKEWEQLNKMAQLREKLSKN